MRSSKIHAFAKFDVRGLQYIDTEVLYMFLDYHCSFDWDQNCISLSGPVIISYLLEITVETPENGGVGRMRSCVFPSNCGELFSVLQKVPETKVSLSKYINIIDQLKENNNLGRSITKANFYRIRGALSKGKGKLGCIIFLSKETIAVEICKYFSTILERHGITDVRRSYLDDALTYSLLHIDPPCPSQLWYGQLPFTLNNCWQSENVIPNVNANNTLFGLLVCPVKFPWLILASLGGEEIQTQRVLGTFFPTQNMQSHKDLHEDISDAIHPLFCLDVSSC